MNKQGKPDLLAKNNALMPRYEELARVFDNPHDDEYPKSEAERAKFLRSMEKLFQQGYVGGCVHLAEIFAYDTQFKNLEKSYFYFNVMAAYTGHFCVKFNNHSKDPNFYQGKDRDFRTIPIVAQIIDGIGVIAALRIDIEAYQFRQSLEQMGL